MWINIYMLGEKHISRYLHWNEYIKMLHTHLSIQKNFKYILKRGRTVGPISILIANFNLNCAIIISQTVYAVYWKYEYCIYLNKK